MNKDAACLVLEWSPTKVTLYDPVLGQTRVAPDIASALDGAARRPVLISPSRRTTFVRALRVPNAPKAQVRQALAVTAVQHFPIPANDLCFDLRLTDDVTEEGRLAVVAAIRASELRAIQAELRIAGFSWIGAVPAAFGSWLLAESLGSKGGAVVTQTAEGYGIDLICEGELRYSRVIAGAAVADSLDVEVARTFAASGLECGPIIAAGPVRMTEAAVNTSTDPLTLLASTPLEQIGISLELTEVVVERERRRDTQKLSTAAAVFAVSVLMALFVYSTRASAQAAVNTVKGRQMVILNQLKSQKAAIDTDVTKALALQGVLDRGFKPAQSLSDVVALSSDDTPPGVWLTGINVERGKPLTMRGTAKTSEQVAQFVQKLSIEPRLRDVRLVFSSSSQIEQTPVQDFSISAFPVGNLPLVETGKVKVRP